MANWTVTQSINPTSLHCVALTISKDKAQDPIYTYVASILDGSGKQKWSRTGDISGYITEAEKDQLEDIIESLFEKAESEMIP